jgi:hypothetical protein
MKHKTGRRKINLCAIRCSIACGVLAATPIFSQDGLNGKKAYALPAVSILYGGDHERVRESYAAVTDTILTEINKYWAGEVRDFRNIRAYLTQEGHDSLERFFRNKRAVVGEDSVEAYIVNNNSFLEVRGIPLIFEPARASSEAPRTEYILLGFKGGDPPQLQYVAPDEPSFHSYVIRSEKPLPPEEASTVAPVIKFIRDLEKAYNDRDVAHLRRVYNKKADIVVGKERSDNELLINRDTKTYLDSLESKFKRVKTLVVRYDTLRMDIRFSSELKNEIAVEVYQIWQDDEYSDKGWVRFYLEFDEKKKGVIGIRDWLPEPQWKKQP